MRRFVLVIVVAACGRVGFDRNPGGSNSDGSVDAITVGGDFVPPWHSGTRIRARVWRTADGEPLFGGWHDTLLDTDCDSYVAADGIERCIPSHVRTDRYFSDTTCASPIAVVPTGAPCGKDQYTWQADVSNNVHILALGAVYAGPIYDVLDSCNQVTVGTSTAHLLGAEVPASSFARTVYHNVKIGNYIHTFGGFEDGAQIDNGVLVLPDNRGCFPRADGIGPATCGYPYAVTPVFTDAACSDRIYAWNRQATDPAMPALLVASEPGLCQRARTMLQPTADVTMPTAYERTATGCIARATTGSTRLLRATVVTDPFPHGTAVPTARVGRLGHLLWIADDDHVATVIGDWDQELGVPCHPFLGGDGTFRCLPASPVAVPATADPTCATGVAERAGACYGTPPYDGVTYASCEDTAMRIHHLANVGTSAYASVEGACVELDAAAGAFGDAIGAEVPAMTFAPLVETIE